jgi:hypothetical protein
MAERIEHWAWRGLASEQAETRAPDIPVDPLLTGPCADVPPAPAQPTGKPPKPGDANGKHLAAIFVIGRKKGYSAEGIKAWVSRRLQKKVDALTSREASKLISDLEAL